MSIVGQKHMLCLIDYTCMHQPLYWLIGASPDLQGLGLPQLVIHIYSVDNSSIPASNGDASREVAVARS